MYATVFLKKLIFFATLLLTSQSYTQFIQGFIFSELAPSLFHTLEQRIKDFVIHYFESLYFSFRISYYINFN